MMDRSNRRPVSGEIVTADAEPAGAPDRSGWLGRGEDVLDAEFEIVGGPSASAIPVEPAARSEAKPGLSMLERPIGERGHFRTRGGPLFWATGLAMAAAAFWISGGHVLFAMPDLGLGETAGLRISSVDSRVEGIGGRPILHVEGGLTNDGAAALPVPPIGIDVTASDGATTRYLLGTNGGVVRPGERFTFSSRLVAPKSGVASVSLSLAE